MNVTDTETWNLWKEKIVFYHVWYSECVQSFRGSNLILTSSNTSVATLRHTEARVSVRIWVGNEGRWQGLVKKNPEIMPDPPPLDCLGLIGSNMGVAKALFSLHILVWRIHVACRSALYIWFLFFFYCFFLFVYPPCFCEIFIFPMFVHQIDILSLACGIMCIAAMYITIERKQVQMFVSYVKAVHPQLLDSDILVWTRFKRETHTAQQWYWALDKSQLYCPVCLDSRQRQITLQETRSHCVHNTIIYGFLGPTCWHLSL